MTYSPLTDLKLPPTKAKWSSRQGRKPNGLNVHHWASTSMAGRDRLVYSADPASANYLIYNDGTLVGSVPEEYRAWTSSSFAADDDKITVEIQNETGAPEWRISAAAFATLVRLYADLASRHSFAPTRANVFGHRDYHATACPGPYLYPRLGEVATQAARLSAGGGDTTASRDDDRAPVKDGKLDEDGKWGSGTTRALQGDLGVDVVDGVVSRQNAAWKAANPGLTTGWEWFTDRAKYKAGSPFIKDFQRLLNHAGFSVGTVDGIAGEKFFKGLQRWLDDLGLYDGARDGELWKPSTTIKALQTAHNKGLVKKAAKEAGLR